MNEPSAQGPIEPAPFVGKPRTTGRMSPVEAVEQALLQVDNATAEELAAFVKDCFGVIVQPRFVPIIREILKDKERRAAALRVRPSFEPGSAGVAEAS
jgi:hypothetical protein